MHHFGRSGRDARRSIAYWSGRTRACAPNADLSGPNPSAAAREVRPHGSPIRSRSHGLGSGAARYENVRRACRRNCACLENGRDDRVSDLHVWRVGPGHCAAVVSTVSDRPEPPAIYKSLLAGITRLSHVTVEAHPCPREHPSIDARPRPASNRQHIPVNQGSVGLVGIENAPISYHYHECSLKAVLAPAPARALSPTNRPADPAAGPVETGPEEATTQLV